MEKLCEENWYQKMQKLAFLGKNYEAVPVPPYRMCLVPVPNRVVPVPQCPKCPDSYNFV